MYVGKVLARASRSERREDQGSRKADRKSRKRQRRAQKRYRAGNVVVYPTIAWRDFPYIPERQNEGKMGANHKNAWVMKRLLPEAILILYAFFATQAFMACAKSHTPIEIIQTQPAIQAHALMGMSLAQLAQVKVNI